MSHKGPLTALALHLEVVAGLGFTAATGAAIWAITAMAVDILSCTCYAVWREITNRRGR